MGTFWSNTESNDATLDNDSLYEPPNINVRLQMQLIIHHWIQNYKHSSSYRIPLDIINLMVEFVHDRIFEIEYKNRCRILSEECGCISLFKYDASKFANLPYYEPYDYLLKIILIGDYGVGKTSIMQRLVGENPFEPYYQTTIGVDFKVGRIEIDNVKFKFQIWDSSAFDRYYSRPFPSSYLRSTAGIIYVYDVNNRDSFRNIKEIWNKWIEDQQNKELHKNIQYIQKILIGNKIDLIQHDNDPNIVSTEDAKQLCQELGIAHQLEISAKTEKNMGDMLHIVCKQTLDSKSHHQTRKIFPWYD